MIAINKISTSRFINLFRVKSISISTRCQFQLAMLIVIFAISNGKCYIEEAQFQITSGNEITDDLFVPSDSKNYFVLKIRVSAIWTRHLHPFVHLEGYSFVLSLLLFFYCSLNLMLKVACKTRNVSCAWFLQGKTWQFGVCKFATLNLYLP